MSYFNQNSIFEENYCDIKNKNRCQNDDLVEKIDKLYNSSKMENVNNFQYDQSNHSFKIGQYRLMGVIGSGNFSVVKLAIHIPTQMNVAVKMLRKTKMSRETLEKTYREVNIMKQLRHGNIVQLYQVVESANWLFIFMEYVPHGALFDHLSRIGRLTENDGRIKFRQILDAVEYCHKMKIVHRDLKAENLLLDSNFNIKLADFGFGSFCDSSHLLSTWCGSPPYAAPELFRGEPYIGPKSDIWSLGVVLYVMVCGVLPFDEPCSIVKLRDQVLSGWIRFPYFLSHECEELIRLILNRDPSKRPSIQYIKDHKWMKISSDNTNGNIDKSLYDNDTNSCNIPAKNIPTRRSRTTGGDSGFDEPIDFTKYYIDNFPLSISTDCVNHIINEDVLEIMARCGYSRSAIMEELSRNVYGSSTATYLLLCQKSRLRSLNHNPSRGFHSNVQVQVVPTLTKIDYCLNEMKINDTKKEHTSGRNSPYDNMRANQNHFYLHQIIVPRNNIEDGLIHETNSPVKKQCDLMKDQNVPSVIIDFAITHENNKEEYSNIHNNYQGVVDSSHRRPIFCKVPTVEREPQLTSKGSDTYSHEMKTGRNSVKSAVQTCVKVNPNQQFSHTEVKPIPKINNYHQNNQLSAGQRHPVYHHSPTRMCQISSNNMPNNLLCENNLHGHSAPLKSIAVNGQSPTFGNQLNKFFEVSPSHNFYNQHGIHLPTVIPQNMKNDRNPDLVFHNIDQDFLNIIYQQNHSSSNRPKCAIVGDCYTPLSSTYTGCLPNNHNLAIMPISTNIIMTTNPSLSSANQTLLEYSASCTKTIPQYNSVQGSQLSSVNINVVRLS